MPGRTAYFGFFEVGKPNKGDTLVVSGAAGAVGAIVAQLGKIHGKRRRRRRRRGEGEERKEKRERENGNNSLLFVGCYVVAIAGSDEKAEHLKKDFGVDHVINYKNAPKDAQGFQKVYFCDSDFFY